MQNAQDDLPVFSELENRLSALEPKDVLKVRRDRWVIGVMLVGVLMTVPSFLGVQGAWIGWVTVAGLILEVSGFAVFSVRQVRDVLPDFIDSKRKFATELDSHFIEYERIRAWIGALPASARERRLAYIESRLDSMAQRYPIVFGAVDKLGFLPMLAGLFLQLQAIKTVSSTAGIFGIAILVLYGMALWMTRYRLQMQAYARLLRSVDASVGDPIPEPPPE